MTIYCMIDERMFLQMKVILIEINQVTDCSKTLALFLHYQIYLYVDACLELISSEHNCTINTICVTSCIS